jgi:RNA polymerase sigma-32 factor
VANLRLVLKLAHEYRRSGQSLSDLVQEGNLGLLAALRKFDPSRGVRLSSYAAFWIRAYMLRYILNNWNLVRLGTTPAQRKLFFNLRKEQRRLEREGYEPTSERVADALALPASEVIEMEQRLGASEVSIDAPLGGNDERTRLETIADSSPAPDERAAAEELRERLSVSLRSFGDHLSGRERALFEKRLLSEEPKTLQELGSEWSVSRERARQIEKQLMGRLRKHLQRDLGDNLVDVAFDRAA